VYDGSNWVLSTTTRDKNGGVDGYDCISHKGLAKNIMTVGAVAANRTMTSFSSWGPTDDGRVKPDIVAKGVSVYSAGSSNNYSYIQKRHVHVGTHGEWLGGTVAAAPGKPASGCFPAFFHHESPYPAQRR
jgi:hypothetical protein